MRPSSPFLPHSSPRHTPICWDSWRAGVRLGECVGRACCEAAAVVLEVGVLREEHREEERQPDRRHDAFAQRLRGGLVSPKVCGAKRSGPNALSPPL